jgi:hypothetical protein
LRLTQPLTISMVLFSGLTELDLTGPGAYEVFSRLPGPRRK